jgi:CheY-like chemotaxis protein
MSDDKECVILLASENQIYRNNLATFLRLQGCVVELAAGGFHLLHLIEKTNDYKLIIIHNDMVDMSAMEIVSLIRVNKTKKELPIVFISADKHSNEEICDFVAYGMNEYLAQSANNQVILTKAKKYCSTSLS